MMIKGRRVGTVTAGIVLVVFGWLFLLRIFIPSLHNTFIISLWPLIFIFLGIEIILSYIINKEEKMRFDFGAVVMIVLLMLFAMALAGAEFVVAHLPAGLASTGFYH